ncbi:hypothetical protein FJZ17_00915 [Candidatus Pacearchaeota archaeon]|nr:hypothetical protein [Candidatus Pacearchaeota archaeon]
MKSKNITLLILFIVFFLNIIILSYAEDNEILKTKGIEYSENTSRYTFTEMEDSLRINGNDYWNIQPETEQRQAYIKVNSDKTRVIEAEFTVNEKGGTYIFGNDRIYVPANATLKYSEGVIKIIVPDGGVLENFPKSSGANNLDSSNSFLDNRIEIIGKNIQLPNGNILNEGVIYTDNLSEGFFHITSGSKINNLQITVLAPEGSSLLEGHLPPNPLIFFDGLSHKDSSETYISMNPNEGLLYFSYKDIYSHSYNFLKGNPFIRVEENDIFTIQPNNYFSNLEISIKNPQNKIPSVQIENFAFIGEVGDYSLPIIINGNQIISIQKDNMVLIPNKNNAGGESSQVALLLNLEKSSEDILLMNSFGGVSLHKPGNLLERYSSLDYQYPEGSKAEAISSLKSNFADISFGSLERLSTSQVDELKDYLTSMPASLRNSLREIGISEVLGGKDTPAGQITIRAVSKGEGSIELTSSSLPSIIHEASHEKARRIIEEQKIERLEKVLPVICENIKRQTSVAIKPEDISIDLNRPSMSPYGGFFMLKDNAVSSRSSQKINQELFLIDNFLNPSLGSKVLDQIKSAVETTPFENEWYAIQPKTDYVPQQANPNSIIVNSAVNYGVHKWEDGTSGPKNGFLSPYSTGSLLEDMAEYTKAAIIEPEIFIDLINPESPRYSPKYRNKLDLLYSRGDISLESYNQILNLAGVK